MSDAKEESTLPKLLTDLNVRNTEKMPIILL